MKQIGLYGEVFDDSSVAVIRAAMHTQSEFERMDLDTLKGDLLSRFRMILLATCETLQKENEAALLEYVASGGAVLFFFSAERSSVLQNIFTASAPKGLRVKRQKTVFMIRHPITSGVSHWTTGIRIYAVERNPLVRVEPLIRDMPSGLIAYARQYAKGRIVCCLWAADREMFDDAKMMRFLQRSGQWLQGKI